MTRSMMAVSWTASNLVQLCRTGIETIRLSLCKTPVSRLNSKLTSSPLCASCGWPATASAMIDNTSLIFFCRVYISSSSLSSGPVRVYACWNMAIRSGWRDWFMSVSHCSWKCALYGRLSSAYMTSTAAVCSRVSDVWNGR